MRLCQMAPRGCGRRQTAIRSTCPCRSIAVAVSMLASYFVSMAVTPVACRYFLGHVEPNAFWKRVEVNINSDKKEP